MFYVFLLGPYDSCCKGPFVTRHDAQCFAESIRKRTNHDATVWDQSEYDANVREYGSIEVDAEVDAW